jgi:hypothetical protein
MKIAKLALPMLVVALAGCDKPQSTSCASISSSDAQAMAIKAKGGMLSRSTEEDQRTFASEKVQEVLTKAEGYAAKVTFAGLGSARLTALIEDDCYIGWTESRPAAGGS